MSIKGALASTGWRRRFTAALFGICATAALPPVYALPLLIPAFTGLFLLVRGAGSSRQAFSDGWWWGLGHFTAGLYWICISLWVDPVQFAWLTPFALFGVPSLLAVYTGLVTLLLYKLGPKAEGREAIGIVIFAALWTAAEYLRAHLFTGFPWNLIGYVWTWKDATLQFASVVGIYGLSWITVFAATVPALFFTKNAVTARRFNLLALLMLAVMTLFGTSRLAANPTQYTAVKIRIVQANIPQSVKWEPTAALKGLQKHILLTKSPGLDSIKLILWPETAVPYPVASDTRLTHDLASILPTDTLLITGGLHINPDNQREAWNSVFVIDADGKVRAQYDKHHLVPFGEYIPLRSAVPALVKAVAADMGDFSRGPGPRTLAIKPYPSFSPLVCYEAIFPDEATDGMGRAEWLFSLTDDAWFGVSSGPYQDVEMARVRAVEQGLPLLRSANTGISGIFDAYGRTLASLPLGRQGILDLYLPKGEHYGTIFERYPQSCILFIFAVSVVLLFFYKKNTGSSL